MKKPLLIIFMISMFYSHTFGFEPDLSEFSDKLSIKINLNFENTQLEEIYEYISHTAGIPFKYDREKISDYLQIRVTFKIPGISAEEALSAINALNGCSACVENNSLFISTLPVIVEKSSSTEIYFIAQENNFIKMAGKPQIALDHKIGRSDEEFDESTCIYELIEEIKKTIEPQMWIDFGDYVCIYDFGGFLAVTCPDKVHEKIKQFLSNYRKKSASFFHTEIVFLEVNRDFYKDHRDLMERNVSILDSGQYRTIRDNSSILSSDIIIAKNRELGVSFSGNIQHRITGNNDDGVRTVAGHSAAIYHYLSYNKKEVLLEINAQMSIPTKNKDGIFSFLTNEYNCAARVPLNSYFVLTTLFRKQQKKSDRNNPILLVIHPEYIYPLGKPEINTEKNGYSEELSGDKLSKEEIKFEVKDLTLEETLYAFKRLLKIPMDFNLNNKKNSKRKLTFSIERIKQVNLLKTLSCLMGSKYTVTLSGIALSENVLNYENAIITKKYSLMDLYFNLDNKSSRRLENLPVIFKREKFADDDYYVEHESIKEIIESTVSPSVWSGEDERIGIDISEGFLIVSAPSKVHNEISKLLDTFRSAYSGIMVTDIKCLSLSEEDAEKYLINDKKIFDPEESKLFLKKLPEIKSAAFIAEASLTAINKQHASVYSGIIYSDKQKSMFFREGISSCVKSSYDKLDNALCLELDISFVTGEPEFGNIGSNSSFDKNDSSNSDNYVFNGFVTIPENTTFILKTSNSSFKHVSSPGSVILFLINSRVLQK